MKLKKEHKLRADWSKRENDIMFHYPLGIETCTDSRFLYYSVFNDDFLKQVKERGYDIKTLKFEIQPDLIKRPDKFKTISEIYKEI